MALLGSPGLHPRLLDVDGRLVADLVGERAGQAPRPGLGGVHCDAHPDGSSAATQASRRARPARPGRPDSRRRHCCCCVRCHPSSPLVLWRRDGAARRSPGRRHRHSAAELVLRRRRGTCWCRRWPGAAAWRRRSSDRRRDRRPRRRPVSSARVSLAAGRLGAGTAPAPARRLVRRRRRPASTPCCCCALQRDRPWSRRSRRGRGRGRRPWTPCTPATSALVAGSRARPAVALLLWWRTAWWSMSSIAYSIHGALEVLRRDAAAAAAAHRAARRAHARRARLALYDVTQPTPEYRTCRRCARTSTRSGADPPCRCGSPPRRPEQFQEAAGALRDGARQAGRLVS